MHPRHRITQPGLDAGHCGTDPFGHLLVGQAGQIGQRHRLRLRVRQRQQVLQHLLGEAGDPALILGHRIQRDSCGRPLAEPFHEYPVRQRDQPLQDQLVLIGPVGVRLSGRFGVVESGILVGQGDRGLGLQPQVAGSGVGLIPQMLVDRHSGGVGPFGIGVDQQGQTVDDVGGGLEERRE